MSEDIILQHADAQVVIHQLTGNKNVVRIISHKKSLFVSKLSCQTYYPVDLIKLMLEIKGPAYLCDEISRDEDLAYVQQPLKKALLPFINQDDFKDRNILDFGCGGGASTVILARMFPECQILGVELREDLLIVARARANFYKLNNIDLVLFKDYSDILRSKGGFDLIVLNAVYEHLLKNERKVVISELWPVLKHGGIMFISQTPFRYSFMESHTAGLPLINYLPDKLVLIFVRMFSKRVSKSVSWDFLLRAGIRGATEREIINLIRSSGGNRPLILRSKEQIPDSILEYQWSREQRRDCLKSHGKVWHILERLKSVMLFIFSGQITMMIQKCNDISTGRR